MQQVAPGVFEYGSSPPPSAGVSSITMRQARLALANVGKLDDVELAIAALPEPQKTQAQIEWEYSNEVQRNKPLVTLLGAALGFSESELDALFVDAAGL